MSQCPSCKWERDHMTLERIWRCDECQRVIFGGLGITRITTLGKNSKPLARQIAFKKLRAKVRRTERMPLYRPGPKPPKCTCYPVGRPCHWPGGPGCPGVDVFYLCGINVIENFGDQLMRYTDPSGPRHHDEHVADVFKQPKLASFSQGPYR